jgi:hypothetical protein
MSSDMEEMRRINGKGLQEGDTCWALRMLKAM